MLRIRGTPGGGFVNVFVDVLVTVVVDLIRPASSNSVVMVLVIFGGGFPGSGLRTVLDIVPDGCFVTTAVPGGGASIGGGFAATAAGFGAGGGAG